MRTTACQEHWRCAIEPALPGLGSLSGQGAGCCGGRGAPGFRRRSHPQLAAAAQVFNTTNHLIKSI
jgi:hypothetical protein